MRKFAQILDAKAHWIFMTGETLAQPRGRFAPDCLFVEITNLNPPPQEGWDYRDGKFSEPHISAEERWADIRFARSGLLAGGDWTQLPDAALTEEQKARWAQYRQALRDLPATCDPHDPVWPAEPK